MKMVSLLLIVAVLAAGMTGCEPVEYTLGISSTEGGTVTSPGEGTFIYRDGRVVGLVATPDEGHAFVRWTGDVRAIADATAASTSITMNDNYSITASFAEIQEMRDWYDLDAIRDNLDGYHVLMNDLDSATAGYEDLAGPDANDGKGWQPIGTYEPWAPFAGILDGQRYEIRDLAIVRPDEPAPVGLFAFVDWDGSIRNLGLVNVDVTGYSRVGGLVGWNDGVISRSYSVGTVTAIWGVVGGLVGSNHNRIEQSYSAGNVTGSDWVAGGLVGYSAAGTLPGDPPPVLLLPRGIVDSYSTASVVGWRGVGGLVGHLDSLARVRRSYATGNVTGDQNVGGLVGVSSAFSRAFDSFWDLETSGTETDYGSGTGKTTTEMMDIATYMDTETEGLDEPWDMAAVAGIDQRNPAYIWNIVDGQTYPFLSWQSAA